MNADEFVKSRQADWARLSALVDRLQSGGRRPSAEELEALGQLYRAATSDLALAQRDFPNARVRQYLNALVARAHAVIYRGEALDLRRVARFYLQTFPALVRELGPFILAAALLFAVPALVAGIALALDPGAAGLLGLEQPAADMSNQDLWTKIPAAQRAGMSGVIMTNNIRVALLAFAGGVSATLLTVAILVLNGLSIGGVLGLGVYYGLADELATFMVAHGVIELTVIFMAGGAGLRMGWALLQPGLYTRRDALAMAGRQAVRLLFGCVPLLVVAGLIEGFVSPNDDIPALAHWAVGALTGVLLYGYLLGAGRPGSAERRRRLLLRLRRRLSPAPL